MPTGDPWCLIHGFQPCCCAEFDVQHVDMNQHYLRKTAMSDQFMKSDQRIVIFDGPDMCGKTNIAKALSHLIDVPYYKNSVEGRAFGSDPSYFKLASRYIDTYMSDFLRQTGTSVIFDRNYPAEYVYPVVFDRTRDLDILRQIDDVHAKMNTLIVVPYRTSYDGVVDDVHFNITSEQLRRIDELFVEFCGWTSCRTLRLCVDDEDLQRELSDIVKFMRRTTENIHGGDDVDFD